MKSVLRWCAAVALFAIPLSGAKAAFIDVNLAGFGAFEGYHGVGGGLNSGVTVNVGAGSTITDAEYIGLQFEALGASWRQELIVSINDDIGIGDFLDNRPAIAGAPNNSPGAFGPLSGLWSAPTGTTFGGSFVASTGDLWVTVYDTFNDGENPDALIGAGTLRIYYTPVPEPTSAALALCGLGLCLVRRRFQA